MDPSAARSGAPPPCRPAHEPTKELAVWSISNLCICCVRLRRLRVGIFTRWGWLSKRSRESAHGPPQCVGAGGRFSVAFCSATAPWRCRSSLPIWRLNSSRMRVTGSRMLGRSSNFCSDKKKEVRLIADSATFMVGEDWSQDRRDPGASSPPKSRRRFARILV